MELYLLRHGVAAERDEWQGKDDELRPLTPKGIARMEAEAKTLKRFDLKVDEIVSSPLTRAVQTAKIVADALNLKVVESQLLKPGFDQKTLATLLREHGSAQHIMVVGHEPDFSNVIGQIIGGGDGEMRKGGIACCELSSTQPPKGMLKCLLPPDWLGV